MIMIMKKCITLGLSMFMALSIAACGGADNEETEEDNKTDIISPAEADSDSETMDGALDSDNEETESEAVADAGNLPTDLEEGEMAMTQYDGTGVEIAVSIPEQEIDLESLKEKNPDICAYILIPGTSINNPVLKKDDSNDYYLEHNVEDAEDSVGCIFMDMGNETDFTDPVTCLYARAGEDEPFSELVDYFDPSFMGENDSIYVYSDEYVTRYRIFAAYNTEDNERPLVKYNFYDQAEYRQYVDEIFSMRDMTSVINSDLQDTVFSTWNIITLIGIDEDGSRQVLQAVFDGRTDN